MSAILTLEGVTASSRHGREPVVPLLDDVSMSVAQGEFVGVCGPRRSGRTTLLRVAAGAVEPERGTAIVREPDGTVTPVGRSVALCVAVTPGRRVLDEVALPLLARRARSRREANTLAWDLLGRVGGTALAELDATDLRSDEVVRVELARALAVEPRFVLFDEPTLALPADERDELLVLLHRLTREHAIGIVVTAADLPAMAGVDRALLLSGGRFAAQPPRGTSRSSSVTARGRAVAVPDETTHGGMPHRDTSARVGSLRRGKAVRTFGRRRQSRDEVTAVADAPLLEFRDVRAVRRGATREFTLLDSVSFEVGTAEHVAVLGRRNPALGSLLRLAGAFEAPAAGAVLLNGHDLASGRGEAVSSRIAYVKPVFATIVDTASAVDHVAAALLPRRLPARERRARALAELERLDAPTVSELHDLALHERMLVALARALVTDPNLILVEEPAQDADPVERDRICALLAEIAAGGPGVLSISADPNVVVGARILRLSGAELTGRLRRPASRVIPLSDRRTATPNSAERR